MKKINIFGKKIPILAILAVLIIGIGSAATFAYYAKYDGIITVDQAISVDGQKIETGIVLNFDTSITGDASDSTTDTFSIENTHDTPILVGLTGIAGDCNIEFLPNPDNGVVIIPPGGVNVDVKISADSNVNGECNVVISVDPYMGDESYTEYMKFVNLVNKDPNDYTIHQPTDGYATVSFVAMGNNFYYELDASNLQSTTEYALIYYTDGGDRFNPAVWGGKDGKIISTFTTDSVGLYSEVKYPNIETNLPNVLDANADSLMYNYSGTPDFYDPANGAKLWIVPTSTLTGGNSLPVFTWAPDLFVFEDGLIWYTDTNN